MPKEKFIPVFIDAKPAETIEPSAKNTLCFVGLLSSSMTGVPKLKSYKSTGGKKKVESAKRIIETLTSGKIELDAIGFTGKSNGQFIQWACDTINQARPIIGGEWQIVNGVPEKYLWNGHSFHRSTALGLSVYSAILPLIGLRAEILTRGSDTNKIKLCLDPLPHESENGMKFMNQMSTINEIAIMWKENQARGKQFEIGTFYNYENKNGTRSPAKHHPCMILSDWFAVSCLANIDPKQLQEEGNSSEAEIDVFAQIWKSSGTKISTQIINLDDPNLQRQVTENNQKK